MGPRITTWNVNGIRNPFGYQPWRDKRTFDGMFDILGADIIVFQETKIQRKDLRDDMVLVPGFDCYWSLPKHKKGYSGVVIYTRNEKCAPIRAEEGITGMLTAPNSKTMFRDLPDEDQIGGYPTLEQVSRSDFDPIQLDSEGRCVILEFPAFVLIGTYCPAERDETRTHFRTAYLELLDARIRNLVKMGKRVIWTGDLNISREEIDTAMAEDMMRKNGVDTVGWISTPARRLFNQMLVGGRVHGERDEGREESIMWDITRAFHEGRKAMYTCWDTKTNARPGNFGARIDYVVCSHDMKDWFGDSNIQEGLMGSDHCPVYAVLKDNFVVDGKETHVLDIMNPAGMFENGIRKQPWTTKNLLPMSGKLIQEFDRRRNIKDMFARKPLAPKVSSSFTETPNLTSPPPLQPGFRPSESPVPHKSTSPTKATSPIKSVPSKRSAKSEAPASSKRAKSGNESNSAAKGQRSLKGFFKSKQVESDSVSEAPSESETSFTESVTTPQATQTESTIFPAAWFERTAEEEAASVATRQSWGKLFAKPVAPKCEHDEPCKTMLTKKPGVNCGRSFWMCNRPLGPSGKQERGTEWRCNTFIWCSDWDARDSAG